MEQGTLYIALALVIFCIAIFILLSKQNKQDKRLLKVLFTTAKDSNNLLSHFDVWNNSAVGIGKENNVLFYVKESDNVAEANAIPIAKSMTCKLIHEKNTTSTSEDSFKQTVKLGLLLKDAQLKNETWLEFYNAELHGQILKGEIQLSEKWNKLINERILSA